MDPNQPQQKQSPEPEVTARILQPSGSKLPKLLIVGLLAVTVVAGLIVVGLYIRDKPKSSKDNKVIACSDEKLTNVSGVLGTENVTLLMPIAEEIQKLPNYDKDPNCLNVVTTYYIHITDSKNARAHFDKLETVYKEDEGFSPKLGNNAKSMDTLRLNVEFLDEQQKQMLQGGVVPSPKVEQ